MYAEEQELHIFLTGDHIKCGVAADGCMTDARREILLVTDHGNAHQWVERAHSLRNAPRVFVECSHLRLAAIHIVVFAIGKAERERREDDRPDAKRLYPLEQASNDALPAKCCIRHAKGHVRVHVENVRLVRTCFYECFSQ